MSGPLEDAIASLYGGDPDAFTAQRDARAAAARSSGDVDAARRIAALRKPIRAAALVNRLVRDQPAVVDELAEIGAELRRAQRTRDGVQLRELSVRRRRAVSAAAQAALDGGGSEAMRAPITSTFEAVLADAAIAAEVRAGTLIRPIEWSGFGDATPSLTLVPSPAPTTRTERTAKARGQKRPATGRPGTPDRAALARAAGREREIAEAEQELTDASEAEQATDVLRTDATGRIEQLEADLVQARLDLRAAGAQHRSAQSRRRDADRRLRRIRGTE